MTTESLPSLERELNGRLVKGRYQLLEILGAGGMAIVYNAYDTRMEMNVALKMILPERQTSALFLERFQVEALSVAQLSHPNIVRVLDYGEDNGVPFLVMEYVPGGTLREQAGRPIPYAQAAAILAPVARGLEYIHRRRLVHRDVKPSNILLTETDVPKLSDFGVVQLIEEESPDSQIAAASVGIGTPDYMSPEQVMNQTTDFRSDIYSLGVVLFELVTGRKPFNGESSMSIAIQHVTGEFPRPEDFKVQVPPLVSEVMRRAVAKNPTDRFANMSQFADALEELARGEKMSAGKLRRILDQGQDASATRGKWRAWPALATLALLEAALLVAGYLWLRPALPALPVALGGPTQTVVSTATSLPPPPTSPTLPAATATRTPTNTASPAPPQSAAAPSPTSTRAPTRTATPRASSASDDHFSLPVALIDQPLPASGEVVGNANLLGIWGIGAAQQILYDQAGQRIFQASSQGVFIYAAETLERLHFIPTKSWVEVIALNPTGNTLFIGLRSGSILVYETGQYQYTARIAYAPPDAAVYADEAIESAEVRTPSPVQAMTFDDDYDYLAIGYQNGTIRVVSVENLQDYYLQYQYRPQDQTITGIYLSDDNRFLYAANSTETINIWDTDNTNARQNAADQVRVTAPVALVQISPDRKWLWVADTNGTIFVYRQNDHRLLGSFSSRGSGVTALAFSLDQAYFAAGCTNGDIHLYRYPSEADLLGYTQDRGARIEKAHPDAVTSLAFSPDGQKLISASRSEGLLEWDVETRERLRSLEQSRPAITQLAFTANDEWLLVERADRKVEIWSVQDSRLLNMFDGTLPDGNLFVRDRVVVLAQEGENTWSEGNLLLVQYPEAVEYKKLPGYMPGWMVRPRPDQQILVAGNEKGGLIWDTSTWERLKITSGPYRLCRKFQTPETDLLAVIWKKGILFNMVEGNSRPVKLKQAVENLCNNEGDFAAPVALSPKEQPAIFLEKWNGKLWQWNLGDSEYTKKENYTTYAAPPKYSDRFLGYSTGGSAYLYVIEDEYVLVSGGSRFKINDWSAHKYVGALTDNSANRLIALGSQYGVILIFKE